MDSSLELWAQVWNYGLKSGIVDLNLKEWTQIWNSEHKFGIMNSNSFSCSLLSFYHLKLNSHESFKLNFVHHVNFCECSQKKLEIV